MTTEQKVLCRIDLRCGCWIDVIEEYVQGLVSGAPEEQARPRMYRAHRGHDSRCLYTPNLWQAQVFVQYY
jgi:hypothetical protein